MSGKISQMPVAGTSAATNTIEAVVSGVSSQMTLATAVRVAYDPAPQLSANLDCAGFDLTNVNNLLSNSANNLDLGSVANPWKKLFYSGTDTAGTTARSGFKGGRALHGTSADLFFGHDNVFNGFYAQRTTLINSAVTANTQDYTNLYQGGTGNEFVALNWDAGDGTLLGTVSTAYPPFSQMGMVEGGLILGKYDSVNSLGGGGLFFHAAVKQAGTLLQHEGQVFTLRSGGGGMGASDITSWRIGGANVTDISPVSLTGGTNDDNTDFGSSANRWKDAHFAGVLNAGEARFTNDTLSAVANTVNVGSVDLSAGNTMLAWYGEGTSVGSTTPTADKTIAVQVNGTTYYLLASTIT